MKYDFMKKEDIKEAALLAESALGEKNAEKTLEKEFENKISAYFAARENGVLCGYCGVWNICGEAEVIGIAVKEDFRRRGIAKALLSAAEEHLKKQGAYLLNLEVRKSNLAAQCLYEKLGFSTVGERKGYYEGKETAVLMTKRIV